MTDDAELDAAVRIAAISAQGTDLERLSRPLLELLGDLTGFESTYVTVLHWDDFKQEVRYARNIGDLEIGEGVVVDWSDTLCRRALLEGRSSTADVPSVWPGSAAARELGIVSYISVPIITPQRSTFGTLCAASARPVEVGEGERRIMELFARLLADQVEREHLAAEERERVAAAALLASTNAIAIASSEHKLKVPLSVIRGAATRLLAAGGSEEERRSLLEAIDRQAAALEVCVLDLLRQAQPSGEPSPLELSTLPLEPLLLRAVADIRLVAGPRTVTLACADRLACTADAAALVHVLEHLLDNAVKYTPDGTSIDVTAEPDGDAVRIVVADRGPGLGGDDLFEVFARGDRGVDGVPGSGLGLHVVRSLVESMGGTVTADDRPGGGARFSIRLPLAHPTAP